MKLQGITLPTSLAVSTPIIVPVGALRATVKLLIVIGMNLSALPAGRHGNPLGTEMNAIGYCYNMYIAEIVNMALYAMTFY